MRKSLGQHFLHRQSVIEHIIDFFNPQPTDIAVEIGPGLGALTYELVERVGQLHVIELDKKLAASLRRQAGRYPNLEVHEGDALKMRLDAITADREVRLIGNLPYSISTPLLFHFLQQRALIRDMLFMLQKEVAERLHASPGSKQYGRLSVMLQQSCSTQLVLAVDKSAFSPAPKVDSAVVHLVPYRHPPHPVRDPEAFAKVVRTAFSQRRKTIRNALKPLIRVQQLTDLGVDPELRPEQLSVAIYTKLSELL